MVDTMFNIPVFSSFAEEMEHRITNGTRPRRGARTQQSESSPVSCRIELLRGGSCREVDFSSPVRYINAYLC